jgi:hypothetical protein
MRNIRLIALYCLCSSFSTSSLFAISWSWAMLFCIWAFLSRRGFWRVGRMLFLYSWHYWALFPSAVNYWRLTPMASTSFTDGPATRLRVGVMDALFRLSSGWKDDTVWAQLRNIVGRNRKYLDHNGSPLRQIHFRCGLLQYFLHNCAGLRKSCLELYLRRAA